MASTGNVHEDRKLLPVYGVRKALIQHLSRSNCVIVIGETGSGKSTQLPQFMYQAGLNQNAVIACTQPRRVAAITVARRVAEERKCDLGRLVGYCVRFDDTSSSETRIRYMTDGMLLREAVLDPLLKRYGVVVLDEAHERTVHTDVLFGVVKSAQLQREKRKLHPLRIVVMSATMDVDHFSRYFNNAPVLYIEGRQHPVEVMYTTESQSDYVKAAIVTLFNIHDSAPPNEDVLIFLTGEDEIETAVSYIKSIAADLSKEGKDCKMAVHGMYAALPPQLQLQVFRPAAPGMRKVIVATNIAETSITIPGIKFVIDSGRVKMKTFHPSSGLDMLKVQVVSQAQAWQRCGRAGRDAPGTCYRLYTEDDFNHMPPNTTPELLRCNLASVVLQLLVLGLQDIRDFDFMDKPANDAVDTALAQLHWLGATEPGANGLPKLTALGRQMSAFPLTPQLAKVMVVASEHKCLNDVITIVALLSVDSVMFTPLKKKDIADEVHRKFRSTDGDHLTLLNVFKAYKANKCNKQWCYDNFLNQRNLHAASLIHQQLTDLCRQQQLSFDGTQPDNSIPIRKSLAAGLFMNSAELLHSGEFVTTVTHQPVNIHPSSALFMCKPACVVYSELVRTTKCYMRYLSVVDPEWLYEISPAYFKRKVSTK